MITPRSNQNHLPKKHNIYTRDLKHFDRENFLLDILATDWDSSIVEDDANLSFNQFLNKINEIMDKQSSDSVAFSNIVGGLGYILARKKGYSNIDLEELELKNFKFDVFVDFLKKNNFTFVLGLRNIAFEDNPSTEWTDKLKEILKSNIQN